MSLRHLKRVRVAVALTFFVPAAMIFLDLTGVLPPAVTSVVTSFQVVPAVIRLFSEVGWSALALLLVLAVTVAFGRVYCSTVCPLGTLQDLLSRLNRNRGSVRRFRFRRQDYLMHYGLLLLATGLAAGGSMLLLNLFEPLSNFGRLMTMLLRPFAVLANNGAAWMLGKTGVYALYDIPLRLPHPAMLIVPSLFLVALTYMSYHHGRLFCNTLCPAGAFLGLLARRSVLRIVIDETTCSECGLCEKVCKSGCIDSDNKRVDFSACVSCFNCLDACPTVGLKYHRQGSKPGGPGRGTVSAGRRRLLRDSLRAAATVVILPGDSLKVPLPAPTGRTRTRLPVSPPGSLSLEHYTSRCTACHLCVSVCPTRILTPSLFEYGIDGIFLPRMDYAHGTCTYECVLCGEVCPNGAILPLPLEEKKLTQIGKAKFIKDECIVVTKKTDCGACSEHCPTKAVRMVAYEQGLVIPELNNDLCIGCGSCEHPCPTTPYKAIYVDANPVHLKAKKPETQKVQPQPKAEAEFPF